MSFTQSAFEVKEADFHLLHDKNYAVKFCAVPKVL